MSGVKSGAGPTSARYMAVAIRPNRRKTEKILSVRFFSTYLLRRGKGTVSDQQADKNESGRTELRGYRGCCMIEQDGRFAADSDGHEKKRCL